MTRTILVFICVLLFSATSFSQGKIFSKAEADKLFGPVQKKILFKTKVLESFLDTHKQLMFKMDNNKINVLGENRRPIISQFESKSEDVYHLFDSEIVKQLIDKGGDGETYVEMREKVLSVTNGVYVLELALPCPPCCPECPEWPWPPRDF